MPAAGQAREEAEGTRNIVRAISFNIYYNENDWLHVWQHTDEDKWGDIVKMDITMTYLLNSGFLVRAGRTLLVFDDTGIRGMP